MNQNTGLNRNTIDKYYTKNNIVDDCLNNIKKYIQINSNDLILEPSAGNGSFIKGIKSMTDNYKFYDLLPQNEEIVKQDYLLFNHTDIRREYDKIHIIGNPPFGRQSSLAIKFIKKSCEFCDSISFILPKSFKKDSLKKKIPLNFHLIYEYDLPKKSFTVDGADYDVPCVFQIWIKKTYNRDVVPKLYPFGFIFVEKTENPDISFRRSGFYAGNIDINYNNKNTNTHYFIKFTKNNNKEETINALKQIIFDTNNTVGAKSISKQELIKEFNLVF
jgi:predicted RNA methylase